jgi:hypothetical protein
VKNRGAILLEAIYARVPSTSREKQENPADLKALKRTHSGAENRFIGRNNGRVGLL